MSDTIFIQMWLYGEVLHSLPAPSRRILIDLPLKPPQDEDWLTYEITLTARLILFRAITCFSCTTLPETTGWGGGLIPKN